MDKKIKVLVFLGGGAIGLILIFYLVRFLTYNIYSLQIPDIQDSFSMSAEVKVQTSEALAKAKQHPTADNLGMLGMIYHSSANYRQAATCYQLAIQRTESAWIWNYYLGYLNMEMSKSDAIIDNFKRVIEKNPGAELAWYYLGEAYKNSGKTELAEMSFGKILQWKDAYPVSKNATRYDYFPLSTYAMFQLSRIYYDKGQMDLAESTLKEIIRNNRSFGPAYRLLGTIYRMKGDLPLSKRYGVRANDLVAFAPPVDTLIDRLVLMSRSELYLLKKIDEAEKSIYPEWAMKLVDHAILYLPDNKYLISKAIKICLMLDQDQKAINFVDQHIEDFQENFTEMNNMGMLFFQKGLYPQSLKYFTRALELKPEDAKIQISMATCFWSVDEKQKSLDILNGLLETYQGNQEHQDLLADITNLLFDMGEEEQAILNLNRLKQLAPTNPKVQRMAGSMAAKNGHIQEAIGMYEASFKGNPEDLSTIRYLGNLLIRNRMWDRAMHMYREGLEQNPNDPYLLERLGTLLVTCPDSGLRNFQEGKYYSERAFIHTTSRSITLISAGRSLAIANAELGEMENARQVISMTLIIARRENMSAAFLSELENIAIRFQSPN